MALDHFAFMSSLGTIKDLLWVGPLGFMEIHVSFSGGGVVGGVSSGGWFGVTGRSGESVSVPIYVPGIFFVLPLIWFVMFPFLKGVFRFVSSTSSSLCRLLVPIQVPSISVPLLDSSESSDAISSSPSPPKQQPSPSIVPCYDPAQYADLGTMPAMTQKDVFGVCERASQAQNEWKHSSFHTRRQLLRILQKFILANQETICRVASRDSGKPLVDAAFGEVMVTCEKINWVLSEGEKWLKPEKRSSGTMMFYKKAWVEFVPVGVVGCIVPWNYPFHNVFNPLVAHVFAGNAVVIKVSEHASWSAKYYSRVIQEALKAVGAPENLVQIVTGYGDCGNALVTCPLVSKVVFVGSCPVGRKVMAAAVETLTPVVLELGGKDPIIVCDDADLTQAVPTAMRGTFQSCGQNCMGAERIIVHSSVRGAFTDQVVSAVKALRQGSPLAANARGAVVDCGAMCMPGEADRIQGLIDDAVSKGAKLLAGGDKTAAPPGGQFYPPTVITDVKAGMRILDEEVFGPVMVILPFDTDDEAIRIANACAFGLGGNVFSRNQNRALSLARRLECGMASINDFATTYMSQSLPFGGVKESGFERFGGVEGLRGCCHVKAYAQDIVPWLMDTRIPPPLQYPVAPNAFAFVSSLMRMFYGTDLVTRVRGLVGLAIASIPVSSTAASVDKTK